MKGFYKNKPRQNKKEDHFGPPNLNIYSIVYAFPVRRMFFRRWYKPIP
jgi:hypothetical protein